MQFPLDLAQSITEQERIGPHTWFGLGGPARWMARPTDMEQLRRFVRHCAASGVDVYKLGQGANLLVNDEGVDGLVLRLNTPAFRKVSWNASPAWGEQVEVIAGGGTDMNRLARDAVRHGLAGLEVMAGIPGSLGGIIRMNAGGRFGQIADVVRDVTVVDPDGEMRVLSREQVGFRYRRTDLADAIVCRATLVLQKSDPVELRKRFLEIWQYKKRTQPLSDSSAGCVFKNPPGGSAGELIDRAGLKNRSIGGAYVSPHHANFICAKEGSTAADVLALIGQIRGEVAARFGVELELEIQVWGHRRAISAEKVA